MIATHDRMDRLYDASAFFNSILKTTQREHFVGQAMLDLTIYELGSTVRKNHKGDKSRMLESFDKCMSIVDRMHVLDMRGAERDVAAMCASTGLTFYDAAYVVAARRLGLSLVTDDKDMSEAARRHGVRAIASAEI